jgi:hypothetical protein
LHKLLEIQGALVAVVSFIRGPFSQNLKLLRAKESASSV